ncbi:hypothetical protein K2X96_02975 [Patescibacteria group bacterium]|nr:hypothetical protein [Patescibacteria group bacterium]
MQSCPRSFHFGTNRAKNMSERRGATGHPEQGTQRATASRMLGTAGLGEIG